MRMLKGFLFAVSVLMIMALSFSAASAVPSVSLSGVPSSVLPGSSFKATVSASDTVTNHVVTSLTLVGTGGWSVQPSNTVSCDQQSCVSDFTVIVPASVNVGTSATFTATVTTNVAGETASDSKATNVASGPSTGGRVPVVVESVEIDGFELKESGINTRDLERGKDFDVRVKLVATSDAKDVEIRAFITGFEFSTREPISDTVRAFDVEKGVTYVKSMSLKLPERVDEDNYRLHLVVGGRDNEAIIQNYRVKVTPSDHQVVIKDFSISPETTIQAGRVLLATVRVKNTGDSDEEDVKIRVGIPELGIDATSPDFINELKPEESATSQEFFLRIGPCVRPGTYDVRADVTFEEGDSTVSERRQITVTEGVCDTVTGAPSAVAANGGVKIIYSPEPQDVRPGGASVSYPVRIVNEGAVSRTYSFSVIGASDWASVKLSPSNLVTVRGSDSQTVFVFVSAKKDAAAGAQSFMLRVKDQAGEIVKELPVSVNVVADVAVPPSGAGTDKLVQLLQVGLVALIVVLVLVGLVLAFRRRGPEGEEGAQTYY